MDEFSKRLAGEKVIGLDIPLSKLQDLIDVIVLDDFVEK